MSTVFQKLAVDYVPALGPDGYSGAPPLDYEKLHEGGFQMVYFRPEDHAHGYAAGAETVAARIHDLRAHGLDGGVWFADPLSADSLAFGIPTDPAAFGLYAARFVKQCAHFGDRPTVLVLNLEFSAKGVPPARRASDYPAWSYCVEGGKLYQTAAAGRTAATKPVFGATPVVDGGVTWRMVSADYSGAGGWAWNEKAASALVAEFAIGGWADQKLMVQPMGEEDFNYGVWHRAGARFSPQCYGDQPYNGVTPDVLQRRVEAITHNRYVPIFNAGAKIDPRLVHPTIGAYGQGDKYVPQIKAMRQNHLFGLTLYPAGSLGDRDYVDYRQFVIA